MTDINGNNNKAWPLEADDNDVGLHTQSKRKTIPKIRKTKFRVAYPHGCKVLEKFDSNSIESQF